ncbi:MAG: glycosyltransferase family 2 protein [Candidatus Eisenbacteria bacterium]|jgi:hypothetical protein|nr:glycosyltransferase family 2 protein [Candidatus Eisenbacteria bacterium]
MDPLVTVVILIHDDAGWIGACLDSIMREPGVEIIVVDNASTDGGADVVRNAAPGAQLFVNTANRGFSAACNQGAAMGRAPFLLFLNPDAYFLPGALRTLTDHLASAPNLGAVGPRQWVDARLNWQWSVVPVPPTLLTFLFWRMILRRLGTGARFTPPYQRWHRAVWFGDDPAEVPYLSGAGFLVRRSAFEEVGGFDERFFIFFEDVDLSDRLRGRGWKLCVVPKSGMVHRVGGTVGRTPSRGEDHLYRSGLRYLADRADPATRLLWWLASRRNARRTTSPAGSQEHHETRALQWSPVPGATSYRVEISPDPAFLFGAGGIVQQEHCILPDRMGALTAGRPLYWRVGAERGTKWVWSPLRMSPPDDPALRSRPVASAGGHTLRDATSRDEGEPA